MTTAGWVGVAAVAVVLLLAPVIFTDFFYGVLLTKALWLGLVAVSLIFLSSYGGMVSLAQTGLFGIAGFTMANLVASDGGLTLELSPWIGVLSGLPSPPRRPHLWRDRGPQRGHLLPDDHLAFGVIVFFFFSQVTQISGFGGSTTSRCRGSSAPGRRPARSTTSRWRSLAAFAAVLYLGRTPFGLTLQGIRDDPTRMRALGYNVALHRTLAFAAAGLIAAWPGCFRLVQPPHRPRLGQPGGGDRRPGGRGDRRALPAPGRLGGSARRSS